MRYLLPENVDFKALKKLYAGYAEIRKVPRRKDERPDHYAVHIDARMLVVKADIANTCKLLNGIKTNPIY